MPDASFGRYTLKATLGKGGFATVYRAWDPALDRDVAIKVLLPHLAEEGEVRQRFIAEARGIARLRHPNIAAVYDVGEAEGQPYFIMELIEGPTLSRLLAKGGALPAARVVELFKGLCSAVDYLHQSGLIHRDIKPANVMLDHDGRVVLMDFGIARALDQTQITRAGTSIGTPEYMSPEQVRGEPVGRASDIYALGVLAYHLLVGKPPFQGDTAYLLFAHVYTPPPPLEEARPGLSPALYAGVRAALEKDPSRRPPSAAAFAAALGGTSLPERPDGGFVTAPWAAPGSPGGATAAPLVPAASSTPTVPTAGVPDGSGGGPTASGGSSNRRWLLAAVAGGIVIILAAGGVFAVTRGGDSSDKGAAVTATFVAAPATAVATQPPLSTVIVAATRPAQPSGQATLTTITVRTSTAGAATAVSTVRPATVAPAATGVGDPATQKLLQTLALTESDFGAGYIKLDETLDPPNATGELASYVVSFFNLDTNSLAVQAAVAGLDAYTDAKAAAANFKDSIARLASAAGANVTYDSVAGAPKLGDETTAYKVTSQDSGVAVTGYAVIWRRGRYIAAIVELSSATVTLDATAKAAQRQDDKLRSAPP